MDAIMNFFNNWYVMGGLVVALLVLVGIMLFLRSNRKDEE
jgi:LPXTG-motif cell wall-anchored protein